MSAMSLEVSCHRAENAQPDPCMSPTAFCRPRMQHLAWHTSTREAPLLSTATSSHPTSWCSISTVHRASVRLAVLDLLRDSGYQCWGTVKIKGTGKCPASPSVMQVTENWQVKVADFNMSRFMEEAGSAPTSVDVNILNPRWLAPEVLGGQRPTLASVRAGLKFRCILSQRRSHAIHFTHYEELPKVCRWLLQDVFSFGVVLWELLTWEIPWAGLHSNFLVGPLMLDFKKRCNWRMDVFYWPPWHRWFEPSKLAG
jgi:hypothetical protein